MALSVTVAEIVPVSVFVAVFDERPPERSSDNPSKTVACWIRASRETASTRMARGSERVHVKVRLLCASSAT